jgi:hypothetical protein
MLGGYTESDKANWDQIVESWRARSIASETTVELVKEIMQKERERGDRLINELRDNFKPSKDMRPPDMKPVGNSVSSWPRIKRELERQSRVNDNAEISREEIEKAIRSEE